MRQFFLVILLWQVAFCGARAQLQESFSDGDFTQNPTWVGDADYFQVNAARQLQSRGPAVTGTTIHLATANTLAVGTQWEFYAQLAFATSSGNYAEVHLTADAPDLKGALRGYFVRMGGTEDEVSLYRKDGTTATRIINGPDKTIAASDNKLWVRVTRTATFDWILEIDVTGTRQNYISIGTVQEARYTTSAFAGVLFRYSQANAQRFYLDDFTIKDIGAPSLVSATVTGARTIDLVFSEPVLSTEASNPANYKLNGNKVPFTADWSAAKPEQVRLQFSQDFETGTNRIEVQRATDAAGNVAQNLSASFIYAPVAQPGDVWVTEIYADFNPLQDLPAAEFIELYNRSEKTFNLQGWTYSDATASMGVFPAYLLRPGAYVIVCAAADTALYKSFGPVLGLASFPSLNDAGDDVELFNATGQLIDFVRYTTAWYQNVTKKDGGWSLERLSVESSCTGASQWKASEDPRGGTPGTVNSVQREDREPPVLQQLVATAPDKILLRFNEALDSTNAVILSHYTIGLGLGVRHVQVLGPYLTEVEVTLSSALKENERYAVTVQGIRDCAGNVAGSQQQTVLLPAAPQKGDVVINEILFNPRTDGVDFVEVVNRSPRYLNLQGWKLANRADGQIANRKVITNQSFLLAPGEYLVFTSDAEKLQREYPAGRREKFLQLPTMPAYPDAAGDVVLLLPNEEVMDEVAYENSQHFKLLSDAEGISLERINLAGPSVAANFHSAATVVQATPGYVNSQSQEGKASSGKLTLNPKTITPDGDGVSDVLLLEFRLPQPGFVATVTIFDAQGRHIRRLSANTLLGAESVLQWDGLTDAGSKAAVGYYVVLVELFNLQGHREVLKETAVVGGRF
ncbi:lamin tail domain-containing protein [Rufibacter radiotolerans]|uniref:lamin tail domain-containing protein n=1 Tax=Rufibacter radiotolerans TaxID=1379910 RepID=UPI0006646D22|nr:lamin tail domain-containing protein [Rufibacter radiotolerans]